jgi:hypothetical protein
VLPIIKLKDFMPACKCRKLIREHKFLAEAQYFFKAEERLKNDFDIVRFKSNVRESLALVECLNTQQRVMLKVQD